MIWYLGLLFVYLIFEEKYKKGYYIVELNEIGEVVIEKRLFLLCRKMWIVEVKIDELL